MDNELLNLEAKVYTRYVEAVEGWCHLLGLL